MSRRSRACLPCFAMLFLPGAALAQDAQGALEAQTGEPPERIDLLAETEAQDEITEEDYRDCADEQDAATITGEIVVCRRPSGEENRLYSAEEALDRHAERTKGDMPMDVNLDFSIPMVGAGVKMVGCFIPPCPPPAAIIIDLEGIPEAPEGSDAERVGMGLAPRGEESLRAPIAEEELGLPPPPEFDSAASPSESASPEEPPSG